jgi:hypothetical protein
MGYELPSFAEMKGHAVTVMNHMAKDPEMKPDQFPFQFPIELRAMHGYQVFLINGTAGLIWKQGVPKELLREQDVLKVHTDDFWAFLSIHVVTEPHKVALQKFLLPHLSPYVHIIEIFADWHEAVSNAVIQAAADAWSKNVVTKMDERESGEKE